MLFQPAYTQLVSVFSQVIKWSDEEIVGFTNQFTFGKFKKGFYLLQPGDVCNQLWFFNKGFCRVVIKADKEKSLHFVQENNFISDLGGLFFDLPAKYHFELLENSEIISIPKTALLWAQENMTEGNKLARVFHEREAVAKLESIYDTYFPDILYRYEKMLLEFPQIEQRVSQRIIASYLNISRVHLSRLKAKRKKLVK
jgi:CRP-like cAMP-binding protein